MNQCPYCGSSEGYYHKLYIIQETFFTFDGEPDGSNEGEESEVNPAKRKKAWCRNCNRYLGFSDTLQKAAHLPTEQLEQLRQENTKAKSMGYADNTERNNAQ